MRRLRFGWLLPCALAALPALAVHTETWLENPSSLARGTTDGVAITRDGVLFLAPGHVDATPAAALERSTQVWGVALGPGEEVTLATGPRGELWTVLANGTSRRRWTAPAPLVTAVTYDPNGVLYVATAPDGWIHRLPPDGAAERWMPSGNEYVWDIAWRDGALWAATGTPGHLVKIDDTGATTIWSADEPHLSRLTAASGGDWFVGSSGSGRIYRVDDEGHAFILHDDDLAQVVGLVAADDGSVAAALTAAPVPRRERPQVTIELPGAELPADGAMTDSGPPGQLQGVIEGLPDAEEETGAGLLGRVVRIDEVGGVRSLWSGNASRPFALVGDGEGGLLFGTGRPARVYRIADEQVALVASFDANLVTALIGGPDSWVATSHPLGLHRRAAAGPVEGTFTSRAFDAGTVADWGLLRWRLEGDGGRVELSTRTGNGETPDETWSAWSPTLVDPAGSPIVNPVGRYLQWRLRLSGRATSGFRVRDIEATYRPFNRPPRLRDLSLEGDSRAVAKSATIRWSAIDPDDDATIVRIEVRPLEGGGGDWAPAAPEATDDGLLTSGRRKGWREDRWIWDTAAFAEGRYAVRAVATDAPANPAGDQLSVTHDPGLVLHVDRTAPAVDWVLADDDAWDVLVADAGSGLRRVWLSRDGRLQRTLRPVDGVTDGAHERLRVPRPDGASTGWKLHAVDAAGNETASDFPAEGAER